MTIPNSLQELGDGVFLNCYKLVPSNIDASLDNDDVTPKIVELLRERSKFAALKTQLSEQSAMFKEEISTLTAQNKSLQTQIEQQSATFTAQNQSLHAQNQFLETLLPSPSTPITQKRKYT
ncbi:hypothetical protein TL16_g09198 [Triparma laevis f. inornata]|uniref:Uncharacterized protein n=2 Tax=Triparma laevis TaxID=1534972 RepID=A0A9W7EFH2_9STRA|nr:hypothetical protein TrLO_g9980 [Triparma laevis f. longispina]GMH82256.1 hypothetical protein TL16_g09198 [Triparma laevis f. inornata]